MYDYCHGYCQVNLNCFHKTKKDHPAPLNTGLEQQSLFLLDVTVVLSLPDQAVSSNNRPLATKKVGV